MIVKKNNINKKRENIAFSLISEAVGTFLFVFMLIAPTVFHFSSAGDMGLYGEAGETLQKVFNTFIVRSLYLVLGFLILVYTFKKFSAQFNPAVTIISMVKKTDEVWMGISKIFLQFGSSFAAAFLIQYFADISNQWDSNQSLDSVVPNLLHYDWGSNFDLPSGTLIVDNNLLLSQGNQYAFDVDKTWYKASLVFVEAFLLFMLLGSIFWGKKLSLKFRPIIIAGAFLILVSLGMRFETISLNPARLVAPAVVSDFKEGLNTYDTIWIFITGQLIAILLFGVIEFFKKDKNEHYTERDLLERGRQLKEENYNISFEINEIESSIKKINEMSKVDLRKEARRKNIPHYENLSSETIRNKLKILKADDFLNTKERKIINVKSKKMLDKQKFFSNLVTDEKIDEFLISDDEIKTKAVEISDKISNELTDEESLTTEILKIIRTNVSSNNTKRSLPKKTERKIEKTTNQKKKSKKSLPKTKKPSLKNNEIKFENEQIEKFKYSETTPSKERKTKNSIIINDSNNIVFKKK